MGFLPFIMALGAKRNLITLVTGIPHERLQIAHQYFSYAMWFTAVIHTLGLAANNVINGSMDWYGSVYWWTGVAAIIPQTWLTFASLAPIRHRAHEFFKAMHFAAAALFYVFLFLHTDHVRSAHARS